MRKREPEKIVVEQVIGTPNREALVGLLVTLVDLYAEKKAKKAREERRVKFGEVVRREEKTDALAELWEPEPKRRARREKE